MANITRRVNQNAQRPEQQHSMSGKSLIAMSLILMIGFQLLHKAGFLIYFAFNKATIIEKSCVNKSVKTLKCDGKCHLRKYMAATEANTTDTEKSQHIPKFPKFEKDPTWSCPFCTPIVLAVFTAKPNISFPSADRLIEEMTAPSIEAYNDIFHPPLACQVA